MEARAYTLERYFGFVRPNVEGTINGFIFIAKQDGFTTESIAKFANKLLKDSDRNK